MNLYHVDQRGYWLCKKVDQNTEKQCITDYEFFSVKNQQKFYSFLSVFL